MRLKFNIIIQRLKLKTRLGTKSAARFCCFLTKIGNFSHLANLSHCSSVAQAVSAHLALVHRLHREALFESLSYVID